MIIVWPVSHLHHVNYIEVHFTTGAIMAELSALLLALDVYSDSQKLTVVLCVDQKSLFIFIPMRFTLMRLVHT